MSTAAEQCLQAIKDKLNQMEDDKTLITRVNPKIELVEVAITFPPQAGYILTRQQGIVIVRGLGSLPPGVMELLECELDLAHCRVGDNVLCIAWKGQLPAPTELRQLTM